MITIFLLAFIVCLVSNLITTGEAYIFFARFITLVNSYGDRKPKPALDISDRFLEIQYTHQGRKYAVMVLKREPLRWVVSSALKVGQWVDRTKKIEYYAGPFRNFHGLGTTPKHISPKYEKLGFKFEDGAVLHVLPDQVILKAIHDFYKEVKVE